MNVVPDTPVTASLNVAVTSVPVATPVAPDVGLRPLTVGAVVSAAAVVKLQFRAANGFVARSVMPEVSRAV